MTNTGIKVLYIMGRGRSGSTIIANLLNELDAFFAVGELHNLWRRGLGTGEACACGAPVPECELWSKVVESMRTSGGVAPARIVQWQSEVVRLRNTRRLLRRSSGRPTDWVSLDAYARELSRVYRAVADVSGAGVVVDSSKRPEHGALLHLVADVEPYFLHLVRDPRAVAYSGRRRKVGLDRELRRYGPVVSTFRWDKRNLASEAVRRHYQPNRSLQLRYEDFVRHPRSSLAAIVELLQESPATLPFTDGQRAALGVNHTLSGNPSRFEIGSVEIRPDEKWRTEQSRMDRLASTSVALPWLRRYGYSILTTRAPGDVA